MMIMSKNDHLHVASSLLYHSIKSAQIATISQL